MNHHRKAITGILLVHTLLVGIPTLAADEVTVDTVDTSSSEWKECLALKRLSPEIAERGTYKIRMVDCVNSIIRSNEIGDIDEENRLSIRARQVQQAFRSGRLGATARSVGVRQPATEIEDQRIVPTTYFRRYTTNTVQNSNRPTSNENFSRPSRRAIQRGALQQTRSSKDEASQSYQERWQAAVDACKDIDSHYHRSNCINRNLRQTFR